MDSQRVRKKFESAREKIEELKSNPGRENGNYLVAGTVFIVAVIAFFGASTDFKALEGEDVKTFGQITQVNYSSGQLSENTVSNIAEAVNESGWEGSKSTARQLNSSWYRINLSTDLPSDERLTLDEQYRIQTTMTIIHHRAFNKSDNVILNIEARDGSTISRFVQ